MTNGEKFQQIFAVSQVDECDLNVYAWLPIHDAIEIPLEWWNANYSEIPTGSTDCISRQAVIDLMMQKWGENFSGDDAMQESIDAIRVMPSVTPQEPETGHWIDDTRLGYHVSICSNCNWRGHGDTCLIYRPKYCPNCGARMFVSHESED